MHFLAILPELFPPPFDSIWETLISEIENKFVNDHDHGKYITTQEFNKLTLETFTAILKQANLASQNDITNLVKQILIINYYRYYIK